MVTKKELEKSNRELRRFSLMLLMIVVMCMVMITYTTILNMEIQKSESDCPVTDTDKFRESGCSIKDPDKLRYAFGTPVDKFINVSELDPSCVIDIRDYSHIGGSVWADIAPECIPMSYFTFRKE